MVSGRSPAVTIDIDGTATGIPVTRSWEVAIGCGDAWSILRADLQAQLRRARQDCGFQYVRCHGMLSDQMQLVRRDRQATLVYNWQLVDDVCDALLDLGLRPFVELGFMPGALASGTQTVFFYRANVTPPADFREWNAMIDALVRHWRDRYGVAELRQWYFEVWNEANLDSFWSGSQGDYFRLYAETARTIKEIDPRLRVGGPATSRAEWLPEFLSWCRSQDVPLDFLSTHVYPDDDEFAHVDPDYRSRFNQGDYLQTVVRRATESISDVPSHRAENLQWHWTEWNSAWRWGQSLHDETNQAAYICRVIHQIHKQVDSFAYWTISDIFNEFPYPRSALVGGFGLLTIDGLPKPAYHAYTLLHRLGSTELPAAVDVTDADVTGPDVWATRSAAGFQILLSHYVPPGRAETPPEGLDISVRLHRWNPAAAPQAREFRVDPDHANLLREWIAAGRPETPSHAELSRLTAGAALQDRAVAASPGPSGVITLNTSLPAAAVVLLEVASPAP